MTSDRSVAEARRRLTALVQGYRSTQVVHAMAALGMPEALREGPRDSRGLAAAVGAHEPSLARLLQALAALGLVRRGGDGRWSLTDMGALLDGAAPGSVRALAAFEGALNYDNWRDLVDTIRTGRNTYERRHGVDAWTYREGHPEHGTLFDAAMQALSAVRVAAVIGAYDFSRLGTIVDVGGGRGSLLAGILSANPGARGVLFDLPRVVAGAPPVLAAAGVADRCGVVGGSFFEDVPPGGDAYLLSVIIHDWEDEPARVILAACRRAMGPSARLLLIERVHHSRVREPPGGERRPARPHPAHPQPLLRDRGAAGPGLRTGLLRAPRPVPAAPRVRRGAPGPEP